ncbi:MAG TPA: ATP-binding protein [Longimicrobiaceae bacterium]
MSKPNDSAAMRVNAAPLHAPTPSVARTIAVESQEASAEADPSEERRPRLIAIVGDSGSGKSTVADAVTLLLGPGRVTDLRLDDYHRYTREERAQRGMTALNPAVHNLSLMQEHLRLLRSGRTIRNRTYEHADGTFGPIRPIEPREIVVVRGLLGFPNDELQAMYDLSVFLQPEPELLFRWKLRRDVQTRGYTEAEVLNQIVQHLLDSKEFVVPQAQRADVVVRYELPTSEARDEEIRTSIVLRRKAAELARREQPIGGLGGATQHDDGSEVRIELSNEMTSEDVDRWAGSFFPETYLPGRVGRYTDDAGEPRVRPTLAVVEVLIAHLTTLLRSSVERP